MCPGVGNGLYLTCVVKYSSSVDFVSFVSQNQLKIATKKFCTGGWGLPFGIVVLGLSGCTCETCRLESSRKMQ